MRNFPDRSKFGYAVESAGGFNISDLVRTPRGLGLVIEIRYFNLTRTYPMLYVVLDNGEEDCFYDDTCKLIIKNFERE